MKERVYFEVQDSMIQEKLSAVLEVNSRMYSLTPYPPPKDDKGRKWKHKTRGVMCTGQQDYLGMFMMSSLDTRNHLPPKPSPTGSADLLRDDRPDPIRQPLPSWTPVTLPSLT